MTMTKEDSARGLGLGQVVEQGEALRRLVPSEPEEVDVVVIGAGQAGLSVGYHLQRRGVRFLILDANARVGDPWRKRWDSLRLFSPAGLDGLDGLAFPAPRHSFPTKDEMADYLEDYARHFALPVRTGTRVERLSRSGRRYLVEAGATRLVAKQVVVAMSSYQKPRLPSFAAELSRDVVQCHSLDYKSPAQLREGPVLVVGAGNSGAEIALDLAGRHQVSLAGRKVGQIPFDIHGLCARLFLTWLVMRVVFHRLLTVRTPVGRKVRPEVISKGGPLIRQKEAHLRAAGIRRVPRVVGAREGMPLLEDGRVLPVANVVWTTGFHAGLSWIDLPIFDDDGEPAHERGVVTRSPGLYFVGLHFLSAFSSGMIHGVGRDAAHVAAAVAKAAGEATRASRAA